MSAPLRLRNPGLDQRIKFLDLSLLQIIFQVATRGQTRATHICPKINKGAGCERTKSLHMVLICLSSRPSGSPQETMTRPKALPPPSISLPVLSSRTTSLCSSRHEPKQGSPARPQRGSVTRHTFTHARNPAPVIPNKIILPAHPSPPLVRPRERGTVLFTPQMLRT